MPLDAALLRASLDDLDREALIDLIIEQAKRIHEQQAALDERATDEAQRSAHRSAGPFARPQAKRAKTPKPPGRKGGHQGQFRAVPTHIDETVRVPLPCCPECQRELDQVQPVRQYLEDLPVMRPHVTELVTYRGRCAQCGPVASTHPLKLSHAMGAAAVQIGPRALALAAELVYDFGLTRRKTCRLLAQRFGLSVSPGGLQQAAHRLARRLRPRYERLAEGLRQAAVVHADETSWYVGAPGGEPRAWLWVFCHAEATLYRVERSRGRAIITETLGERFGGVLVSDCLNIYDGATPLQHKCYAHHLKAISAACAGAEATGQPVAWLHRVRALLHAAMALKRAREDLAPEAYARYRERLERQADAVLAEAGVSPWEQSIRLRLSKQRDHLFAFLRHEGVGATNNLAERQLRPAVITRKVMCGNRSGRGAATWQVLASLSATARQRGSSLAEWIVQELCPSSLATTAR